MQIITDKVWVHDKTNWLMNFLNVSLPDYVKVTVDVVFTQKEFDICEPNHKGSNGCMRQTGEDSYYILIHEEIKNWELKEFTNRVTRLFHELIHVIQFRTYTAQQITMMHDCLYDNYSHSVAYMLEPIEIQAKYLSRLCFYEYGREAKLNWITEAYKQDYTNLSMLDVILDKIIEIDTSNNVDLECTLLESLTYVKEFIEKFNKISTIVF